jgi:phosphate-selective porin OprO and OprP
MTRCRVSLLAGVVLAGRPALAQTAEAGDTGRSVRVSAYLQPRFQDSDDTAAFRLRRARFAIDGRLTAWAALRMQVELVTNGAPAVPPASPLSLSATDLFVRLDGGRWGGTVGQFRVPFSLESLLSSTILETTERSRIVNAAKRDIGAQIDWRVPGRLLLEGAVVDGEGPNRGGNPDNRMAYFARAVLTPVGGLDVGGALEAYPDSSGADVQALFQRGRWHLRSEYLTTHHRDSDTRSRGWYALAAFLVRPPTLQLVGRVEQHDPSDQIATDRVSGYSLGAQYFLRGDDVKVLADYELFHGQTPPRSQREVIQLQVRF